MKLSSILLVAVCFAARLSTSAAEAKVEFVGYLGTHKDGYSFVLTDPARGVASEFLKIGQSFKGFTLMSFTQEKDVLVVLKKGILYDLPLKEGKVVHAESHTGLRRITFNIILLDDGTVIARGKRIPVEALQPHIQEMTLQADAAHVFYSVLVQPGPDAKKMASLKQQLLSVLPTSGIVKLQGGPPPSPEK